ncbi:MAG: hypothetical protein IK116_01850 [Firmicutes bacterium]|nr:hypothetical protein [Bacillota bacterium]
MKKRIALLTLCIVFITFFIPATASAAVSRDTSFEQTLACSLKSLNLFQGVSENDFALDREPTRTEALVMLIRVLGKESEAVNGAWHHPFEDVPAWADRYVGYAFEKSLTNGISQTRFGSTDKASAAMYITFVLRSLGYSDANNADFKWSDPYALARNVGILPSFVDTVNFWRADVVVVSYAALPVRLKDSSYTLADKLIEGRVFTQGQYEYYYDDSAIPYRETIYAEQANGVETIHYEWNAFGDDWYYDLKIPVAAVNIYKQVPRDSYSIYSGYTSYVTEPSDDEYLGALAQVFLNSAAAYGMSDDEAVMLAVAFVQSLKYTPDDIGLGYDYPKYPLETLYDQGGDCEDTSILLVSLIKEMGYGCALIMFDDHMGVGILGDDSVAGYYYEAYGNKYFYVETTDVGWQIGEMPDVLLYKTASVWAF